MSEPRQPASCDSSSNHNAFSKCAWDLPKLLERLEADEDLLRELLLLFQHDAAENLLKARQAWAEEDQQSLSCIAHTLRGMLRTLSMDVASDIAAQLEVAAAAQGRDDSANLLRQLEQALADVLAQVGAWLAR